MVIVTRIRPSTHKDVPETYEYVPLHGKRDTADMIKDGEIISDSPGGPNVVTKTLVRGRQENQRKRD